MGITNGCTKENINSFLENTNGSDNSSHNSSGRSTIEYIDWLLVASCGPPVYIEGYGFDNLLKYPGEFPSEFDTEKMWILTTAFSDFPTKNLFKMHLYGILDISLIAQLPIKVEAMRGAMINLNYDIGFEVNRGKIGEIFNATKEFTAFYDNTQTHYCMIKLPVKDGEMKMKRKKSDSAHTFLVYRSGKIMQSSPDLDGFKDAYNKFMNILLAHKENISINYSIYENREYYNDILRQLGILDETNKRLELNHFYTITEEQPILPQMIVVH
jgi:hypothetical protein